MTGDRDPPPDLELRARPRPIRRLNKRALMIGSGVVVLLIAGATIVALNPPRAGRAGQAPGTLQHRAQADGGGPGEAAQELCRDSAARSARCRAISAARWSRARSAQALRRRRSMRRSGRTRKRRRNGPSASARPVSPSRRASPACSSACRRSKAGASRPIRRSAARFLKRADPPGCDRGPRSARDRAHPVALYPRARRPQFRTAPAVASAQARLPQRQGGQGDDQPACARHSAISLHAVGGIGHLREPDHRRQFRSAGHDDRAGDGECL